MGQITNIEKLIIVKPNTDIATKYSYEINDANIGNYFDINGDEIPLGISTNFNELLALNKIKYSIDRETGLITFEINLGRYYSEPFGELKEQINPIKNEFKVFRAIVREMALNEDGSSNLFILSKAITDGGILKSLKDISVLKLNDKNINNYFDFKNLGQVDSTSFSVSIIPNSIELGINSLTPTIKVNIKLNNILTVIKNLPKDSNNQGTVELKIMILI